MGDGVAGLGGNGIFRMCANAAIDGSCSSSTDVLMDTGSVVNFASSEDVQIDDDWEATRIRGDGVREDLAGKYDAAVARYDGVGARGASTSDVMAGRVSASGEGGYDRGGEVKLAAKNCGEDALELSGVTEPSRPGFGVVER